MSYSFTQVNYNKNFSNCQEKILLALKKNSNFAVLHKGDLPKLDILDRIIMLMGSRDQKELTKYLQLNAVAFSDWKSGKSNSYKKYLIEIAKFFNVSIDYLVYGKTPDSSLRTDEEELLQDYNSVDIVAKAQIRERAAVLAELEAAKKKNNYSI